MSGRTRREQALLSEEARLEKAHREKGKKEEALDKKEKRTEQISAFCRELAELWANHEPDLRFGQILSALPEAISKPGHAPFFLEEDEMLETLRRLFGKDFKTAAKEHEKRRLDLADAWQSFVETLEDDNLFETTVFQKLFVETWQYFIEFLTGSGINGADLPIVCWLAALSRHNAYPENCPSWEFNACLQAVKGLLFSMEDPLRMGYRGSFFDGYITVEEWHRAEKDVHISQFAPWLEQLAEQYREESGEED